MKILILFLSLLSVKSFAVENIGFCSEVFAGPTYKIADDYFAKLSPDQILIRGKIGYHWETGFEGNTMWLVAESDLLEKGVYRSSWFGMHSLADGDLIYFLNPENKVILKGYYKGMQIGNLRQPTLYGDSQFTYLILDYPEFTKMAFAGLTDAVVIKQKSSLTEDALAKIREDLPVWFEHQKDPRRFYKITDTETIELGPYQVVIPLQVNVRIKKEKFSFGELESITYFVRTESGRTAEINDLGYVTILSPKAQVLYKGHIADLSTEDRKKLLVFENKVYAVINRTRDYRQE